MSGGPCSLYLTVTPISTKNTIIIHFVWEIANPVTLVMSCLLNKISPSSVTRLWGILYTRQQAMVSSFIKDIRIQTQLPDFLVLAPSILRFGVLINIKSSNECICKLGCVCLIWCVEIAYSEFESIEMRVNLFEATSGCFIRKVVLVIEGVQR